MAGWKEGEGRGEKGREGKRNERGYEGRRVREGGREGGHCKSS